MKSGLRKDESETPSSPHGAHAAPHSADALAEASRDHWWNRDFLELMGRRLRLGECRRVLDAGCGRGHWGRALSAALPSDASILGVDREAAWVSDARDIAQRLGLEGRFRYRQGDVEALEWPDASFDLVTCQTLLIHVPDPKRVLREMLRVLRPGGLLLAAEPNNYCQCLRWNTLADEELHKPDGIANLLRVAEFYLRCGKGKVALGEGSSAIGDLLPGYFNELGMHDISAYQTDKAAVLIPPYSTPVQRDDVADILQIVASKRYIWREEESRRYYLAGGGTDAEFAEFWLWAMGDNARLKEAIEQGRYHAAGGSTTYLVSGRKPID